MGWLVTMATKPGLRPFPRRAEVPGLARETLPVAPAPPGWALARPGPPAAAAVPRTGREAGVPGEAPAFR